MTFSHPDFTIIKELGRGASATVYLAVHKALNRRVALKVLRCSWTNREQGERFQREAIILAKLDHPHIVPVYELRELDEDGSYLIVMRYIDGGTLRDRAGTLTVGECVKAVTQLAEALDYAHRQGFLHRDIKPENVLFDNDRALLVDFGIARAVDSFTRLTRTGSTPGTPGYMSPEQASGERLDARSDLYGLGIMFYELLSGNLPFQSESAAATGIMHLTAVPPPLPAGLACFSACVQALFAKDPSKRPADAKALLSQLQHLGGNLPFPSHERLANLRSENTPPLRFLRSEQTERRQLTVLCCEVSSFSELSGKLDPEQLFEVVQAFREACESVVHRYGGQIARFLADGLVAYFGHPVAHEDDAKRAVHAGLGIPQALDLLNRETVTPLTGTRLTTRIGIDTGPVVTGDAGGLLSQESLVVGEPPSVAARIQSSADPDSTVVSVATQRLVAGEFHFEKADHADPAAPRLFRVLAPDRSQTRFSAVHQSIETGLFGREREFRWLSEQWTRTLTDGGRLAVIHGEAGIGKSCLVNRLLARFTSSDCLHIVNQCSPYHADSTLYPALQHLAFSAKLDPDVSTEENATRLRCELGLSEEEGAIAMSLLGPQLGLVEESGRPQTESPERRRELTLRLLADYLFRCARRKPLMFVIEDVHWLDPTTFELVTMLLESIERHRVLCILTARPPFNVAFSGRPRVTSLTLHRLDDEAIVEVVESTARPQTLPTGIIRQIVERSDGVPLFAEELTKNLLESALTGGVCGEATFTQVPALSIPSSLHDILAARLDRMGLAKSILQVAACIGRDFSRALLAKVSPIVGEELDHGLELLTEAGLIHQQDHGADPGYTFKHALVRDAAYESSLRSKRTAIHAAVLAALRTDPHAPVELLAYHASQAHAFADAMAYWDRAGGNAIDRAAFTEAIAHFEHAIDCARELPDHDVSLNRQIYFRVRQGHASTAVNGFAHPETERSNAAARALLDRVGENPYRYPVLYGHWVISHAKGKHLVAVDDAREMLADARSSGTREQLMMAHRLSGASRAMMGEFEPALSHFEQFDETYDADADTGLAVRYGTDPLVAVRTYRAIALLCRGETNRAAECVENLEVDADALGHQHTIIYALAHLALIHQVGRLADRRKFIDLANRMVEENDLMAYKGHALGIRAMYLFEHERFDESLAFMVEALAVIERTRTAIYTPLLYASHSVNLAELGRHAESQVAADTALAMTRAGNEFWALGEIHRLIAAARYRATGDTQSSIDALRRAIAMSDAAGAGLWSLRASVALARLLTESGQQVEASMTLKSAIGGFPGTGSRSADLQDAKTLLTRLQW